MFKMGFQESLSKLSELSQQRKGDSSLGVWVVDAVKLNQTDMSRQLRNFNK